MRANAAIGPVAPQSARDCQQDDRDRTERQPRARRERRERIDQQHADQRQAERLRDRELASIPARHEIDARASAACAASAPTARRASSTRAPPSMPAITWPCIALQRRACAHRQSHDRAAEPRRQRRDHADVQARDRHQVRRPGRGEHAPLLRRHRLRVTDRESLQNAEHLRVAHCVANATARSTRARASRRSAAMRGREPRVALVVTHIAGRADAFAKQLRLRGRSRRDWRNRCDV